MIIASLTFFLRRRWIARALLALTLVIPAGLVAAEQPHSFAEKTSTAFAKLKALVDAKDWDGMLAVLKEVELGTDPKSYDMSQILDMEAKAYGQKEQYAKAIEAWDAALKMSEGTDYFTPQLRLEYQLYLAQFSYQEGSASKDPAVQRTYFNRAAGYFKQYLAGIKKPNPDIQMFYASILYNQAVLDPNKVDQNLLKEARTAVQKGLTSSIHPKEGLYMLLLAILQQQNDLVRSAETLELILSQFPTKKDYWPSLWSTYLAMANDKDPDKVRENYIRAINTMERAQALGLMNTPKDNLNLVSLYLAANQLGKCTDLLHKGLRDGTIESDIKNWMALGYYYQQSNKDAAAIAAYNEGASHFPNNGQIDLAIAEIYRGKDDFQSAIKSYRTALNKGNLEKPSLVWAYLANALFTIEQLDEAKAAIVQAEKYPESAKDTFLPQLKEAIEHAIAERDALKTPTPTP